MNWIFKTGDHFQMDRNDQNAIVTIEQRRNFTGKEGEDVLILEKNNSEWGFIAYYRIASILVKNPEAEFKEISIILSLVQQFKEEKLLEDYIYSLRRITNYANPIKHFSRKFSRLYDAEFEAIVEDKIYLKRTILGTVLNAMHEDHQKSFISFVASEAPEILTGKTDMDTALMLLLQYLEFAVVKPAEYLRESADLLKSITSQQEFSEVGFAVNAEILNAKDTQMIKPQVETINEYLGDMFRFNNEKLGLQLLELDDNGKFKSLFKNSPLPMTLS